MMGRRDLGDMAAGRAELDRDHPGLGNDLQAHFLDLRFPFFEIVHLETDMVDAGPVAADLGIEGCRAFLKFHEGEIDVAVGHVAGIMVAVYTAAHVSEAKDVFVEFSRRLEIVDFY